MNKEQRDKFLTEAIGECWHEAVASMPYHDFTVIGRCKCGMYSEPRSRNSEHERFKFKQRNDFSTWEGFGKLWEWVISQAWVGTFCKVYSNGVCNDNMHILCNYLHPDRLADAVFKFLQEVARRSESKTSVSPSASR